MTTTTTTSALSGSVGRGGANWASDVRLVQHLLNDAAVRETGDVLAVDGIAGPKTTAAIERFQRGRGLHADARADPGGPTIRHLVDEHLTALLGGVIRLPMAPGDPVLHGAQGDDAVAAAAAEYLRRLRG